MDCHDTKIIKYSLPKCRQFLHLQQSLLFREHLFHRLGHCQQHPLLLRGLRQAVLLPAARLLQRLQHALETGPNVSAPRDRRHDKRGADVEHGRSLWPSGVCVHVFSSTFPRAVFKGGGVGNPVP
jgi:hypothetical protein